MLATRCKYRNDSTSDSTGWPGELALQVQCRTTHAIKVSQRKRRSESNRFRYESMSEPEDRPTRCADQPRNLFFIGRL